MERGKISGLTPILKIVGRRSDDELIQARLFLTASTGNVIEGATVTAFFNTVADRDAAAEALGDLDADIESSAIPDIDWLERYQQSLEPLFIGRSFVVVPDPALLHVLVIPQEQAFGTGSHESTALCIELLETLDLRGKAGLDIGAGSGILALAMRRLGARHVIAFDNDLDTYAALRENAMRNGIEIAAFVGTLDALRGGVFDVITMNILPDVIVPLLPRLRAHLRGTLVLSGILLERRPEILAAAAAAAFELVGERSRGEWWAGGFRLRTP